MNKIGKIVQVSDQCYGDYIGEVKGFRSFPAPVYLVSILACTRYPLQTALFNKHASFKRIPFSYLSIHPFSNVVEYTGKIPEYDQSVQAAFKESQLDCFV